VDNSQTIFLVGALVVALALFFDFTNGFHDTANAMATPIATGALKPRTAVIIAAIMNLVGAFLSTAVAKTISTDTIKGDLIAWGPAMIFAGLTGAILWNLTTWFFGLPSSSSHALFGGLIGAAIVYGGFDAVNVVKVVEKVIIPALFAPFIAGVAAWLATSLAYIITGRKKNVATGRGKFKVGQIFSSSLVALSHGTNDAQKTMGVITLVLISANMQSKDAGVPLWVIVSAAIAISVGTFSGGWRIIKTMGHGLAEIRPAQGFAAESATGATILASSHLGFALSTTQVASGSVIGSGLGRVGAKVRWGKAGQIVIGWFLTLPAAAGVGMLSALLTKNLGEAGLVLDAILAVIFIVMIFQMSRKNAITHKSLAQSDVEEVAVAIATPAQVRREAKKAAKAAKASVKKGKK
jgi:PiT family inorganic phosphate transporter